MIRIWLMVISIVYLSLVTISTIYYIIISIKKRESFTDSYLRDLKREPLVSIIVPTLNEESNIVDCITSLKAQNYSNYEIIVSDGGSTDKTIELAKPLASQ